MTVLNVIIGNLRGGRDSFESAIKWLEGDFALCIGKTTPNYWHERAKYVWEIEEYSDWNAPWDAINGTGWHKLWGIKEQYLGPCGGQSGSSGILLYFRYCILDKLE